MTPQPWRARRDEYLKHKGLPPEPVPQPLPPQRRERVRTPLPQTRGNILGRDAEFEHGLNGRAAARDARDQWLNENHPPMLELEVEIAECRAAINALDGQMRAVLGMLREHVGRLEELEGERRERA